MNSKKELLSVKGYVHDSLAQKLPILHMFLLKDESTDLREIKKMLLELDLNDTKQKDDISYLQSLLSEIGVTLNIEGTLPKDKDS